MAQPASKLSSHILCGRAASGYLGAARPSRSGQKSSAPSRHRWRKSALFKTLDWAGSALARFAAWMALRVFFLRGIGLILPFEIADQQLGPRFAAVAFGGDGVGGGNFGAMETGEGLADCGHIIDGHQEPALDRT